MRLILLRLPQTLFQIRTASVAAAAASVRGTVRELRGASLKQEG